MTKKPFSLTYVTYEEGDVLGFLAAGVTLAPIFLMVMYASLIIFRREFHTMAMLVGQLLNEISSVVLKEISERALPELAQRPEGSDKTDSGLPSSHAQFMFFFATYSIWFLLYRVKFEWALSKTLLIVFTVAFALAVAFTRWYLSYHTAFQIAVGMGLGCLLGTGWWQIVSSVLAPQFAGMEEWPICAFFHLRDSGHIGCLAKFECEQGREHRRRGNTKAN